MKPLLWMAQNWRSYLGYSGAIGAAALLLTLAGCVLWLQPQRTQRLQLLSELQQAHQPAKPNAIDAKPKLRLADFYRQFPHLNTAPDWLDQIDQKLDAHKLVLKQADYKLVRERNTPLLRYQLNLPVSGDYLAVRSFVQELQQAMPFAIVDDLLFERDAAAQATVQARIRLSLMFGGS